MSTKTLILAAIVSTGFLFSCRKANIQPNSNSVVVSDESVSSRAPSVTTDTPENGTHKNISSHDGVRDIIRITDPNNDEDRNKRKKGK